MGKRGPAAKGEYPEKSAVLSTRITPELRVNLEAAVEKSGLTLSREIEHRLRRTFADDAAAIEAFGSRRNQALMQMLAHATRTAWNPKRPEADWLDDPALFDQVVKTLVGLLDAIRPQGPTQPLTEAAAVPWLIVQTADASLPFGVTKGEHRWNKLKADLGSLATRPKIPPEAVAERQREREEFEQRRARDEKKREKAKQAQKEKQRKAKP